MEGDCGKLHYRKEMERASWQVGGKPKGSHASSINIHCCQTKLPTNQSHQCWVPTVFFQRNKAQQCKWASPGLISCAIDRPSAMIAARPPKTCVHRLVLSVGCGWQSKETRETKQRKKKYPTYPLTGEMKYLQNSLQAKQGHSNSALTIIEHLISFV